jgi:hypothetical protein
MLARLLRLHPSTYKRLVRLSKEAERDGAYRVAKRLQAVVLELGRPNQRRVGADSQGAAIEGVRVAPALSDRGSGWSAGRLSVGPTIGTGGKATATVGGHCGQWSGGLRSGQRHLDIAHDRLGDRGGVRRSVSPRSWAQVAPRLGIFGAASTPHSGPRRCRGAGPLAPAHLSEP